MSRRNLTETFGVGWQPAEPRLPKLPSVGVPRPTDDPVNLAAHADLAPFIAHAKAHKELFVGRGHEDMPPLVFAIDADGKPLVDAIVLRTHRSGPGNVRDAALTVAERLARGINPAKLIVVNDGYHQVRPDGRSRLGPGELQNLHTSGRGAANGVSECLLLNAINRTDDASMTVLPYEWDRSKKAKNGFRWCADDDRTAAFGGDGRISGLVIESLRTIMDAPFYADDPELIQGLVEGGFGAVPDDERHTTIARCLLACLVGGMGCAIRTYGDRFGEDVSDFIQEMGPLFRVPEPTYPSPEVMAKIVRDMETHYGRFQPAPPGKPPRPARDRGTAQSRAAERKRAEQKRKKQGGDS